MPIMIFGPVTNFGDHSLRRLKIGDDIVYGQPLTDFVEKGSDREI